MPYNTLSPYLTLSPKSGILNPAPGTPHPAPYIVLPTPYTPHPTPQARNPKPQSLNPDPHRAIPPGLSPERTRSSSRAWQRSSRGYWTWAARWPRR
jgi:hypothetical protein